MLSMRHIFILNFHEDKQSFEIFVHLKYETKFSTRSSSSKRL
jgi:hypothetical protein